MFPLRAGASQWPRRSPVEPSGRRSQITSLAKPTPQRSQYLVVWSSAGVLAFTLGALIAGLAEGDARLGTAAGVAAYLGCGLYQLSPLKYRCLAHCRSPLSLFLKYSSYQGLLRDFRVGAHHGAYCLGCCWALMVVLLALGAMSVVPMLILASWSSRRSSGRGVRPSRGSWGSSAWVWRLRRSGSPGWRPDLCQACSSAGTHPLFWEFSPAA